MNITLTPARIDLKQQIVEDIPGKVREEFRTIAPNIRPGMKIAVTAGSRGINNIALIIKTAVDCLKEAGAEPFIIPAMGSHGGATAEGQRAVLAGYGVTEEAMGVPVKSSMEVVKIGETEDPKISVFMDKNAWEADGVLDVNRVKCHTDFHGVHESGIVKMLCIGLGKHAQALAVHKYGADGLRDYVPVVAKKVIGSGKIVGAIAILEDGFDHTADIKCALPADIFRVDEEFNRRSHELIAKLPFDQIDVLIVDRMGKEVSGTGLDTNVIGRIRIPGQEDGLPFIRKIVVLNLSEASHGNALGIGLADVTTRSLADSIDWKATYENVITSGFLQRGFLPIVAENDKEAVDIAVRTSGQPDLSGLRVARIESTLKLGKAYLSAPLLKELTEKGRGVPLGEAEELSFDGSGRIAAF